ncbi:MAG: substrate-binding domain-containing protein [Steroidobacter sp.]
MPPGVRVLVTPNLARIVKEMSPRSWRTSPSWFDVDTTGTALRALCTGAPELRPDVVITSRRISKDELRPCDEGGLDGVLEAILGHVAIVVTRAKSGEPMPLSAETLRRAILKRVPAPDDPTRFIPNPYSHWNQIDPSLEARRIEVLGPARDSSEFQVLIAALLEPACAAGPASDRSEHEPACHELRDDGFYTTARFDGTFIRQRLWSDPSVVAVLDYRFYAANSADLLSLLTGAAPTRENIVNGSYPLARTLRLYVTRFRSSHAPPVSQLVHEYLRAQANSRSDVVIAPDGATGSQWPPRPAPLNPVKLN